MNSGNEFSNRQIWNKRIHSFEFGKSWNWNKRIRSFKVEIETNEFAVLANFGDFWVFYPQYIWKFENLRKILKIWKFDFEILKCFLKILKNSTHKLWWRGFHRRQGAVSRKSELKQTNSQFWIHEMPKMKQTNSNS